jgi:hypothetical protein
MRFSVTIRRFDPSLLSGEIVNKGTSTSIGIEGTAFKVSSPFFWLTSLLSFCQMTDINVVKQFYSYILEPESHMLTLFLF